MSARALISYLLAAFVVTPLCAPASALPLLEPCDQLRDIYACKGAGQVIIGGTAKHGPQQSPVVPVVDPIGAVRLIECGAGTAAALAALGDPFASDDAAACIGWTTVCQQSGLGRSGLSVAAVRVVKQPDGSWSLSGSVCQQPARPQVTGALVREQVARLVPRAAIGVAPQQVTLVNIQTIMWVATAERRTLAPLTVLGRRVVVTLRLDHVDWDFGDGQRDAPATAGKAYDGATDPCTTVDCPGYYGHTYVGTGAMTVTAQASWAASFTVDGGPALAIPGTVTGPVATAALQVKQARGILVPNPPDR